MKEIASRLTENRQIQLAKEILESNGYKIRESRSPEIEKMMDFIDDAMSDHPEETEEIVMRHNASEDDTGEEGYFSTMSDEDIRAAYEEITKKAPDAGITDDEIIQIITEAIYDQGDDRIRRIETFREAGLLTSNNGFVVTTVSGKEFQFSLLGSY